MVLVTGGTGFIGAYIIKELISKGYAVRAIRRGVSLPYFIDSTVFNQVEWVEGNILDVVSLEEAMTGVDSVIHAAGKVSYKPSDSALLYQVNIEGTANVVNVAVAANVKRFVHISSIASIGRKADGSEVDENKEWEDNKHNTPYAVSKYQGELEVWRGIAEGLSAVILNPTIVLGYGNWDNSSAAIFKRVYNEFRWYTHGVTGFVDVEDTARAAVLLMESSHNGERYIINGDNWSFHQLFNTIADGFNKKRPSTEATPFLSGIAWRLEKLKSWFGADPLITRDTAKVGLSSTRFSNKKILKALPGFTFTPLDSSISKACMQYRHHLSILPTSDKR
ncbi:MAG TPA: NAD-dependent epimerase/dehydratase family protein [Flavitalea sp.]|nr:NAD-dependent epimerase/dehydratase family protein [Flavitalea sp.]